MEKKKGELSTDDSRGSTHPGVGQVSSGGGPIFIGSNNAGRDITNIQWGS